MQARIVAASRGARWLAEGWRLFRAAPFGWLGLAVAYLVLTQGLALVPVLGAAVAAILVPALTVGVMSAARAADAGGRVEFRMLLDGLRQDRRNQLILGGVYLAGALLTLAAFALADQDGGARALLSGKQAPGEVQTEVLFLPLSVVALAYTPVMMMFWFAPPLAAWHGVGPVKALFFSFFACLINWRAFLAYGAVTAALAIGLPSILLSLLLVATAGAAQFSAAAMALAFPLLVFLLPILFASFYASYRDVFASPETPEPSKPLEQ